MGLYWSCLSCGVCAHKWTFHSDGSPAFPGSIFQYSKPNKTWGQTGKAGLELPQRSLVHVCIWLDLCAVAAWTTLQFLRTHWKYYLDNPYTQIKAWQLNWAQWLFNTFFLTLLLSLFQFNFHLSPYFSFLWLLPLVYKFWRTVINKAAESTLFIKG